MHHIINVRIQSILKQQHNNMNYFSSDFKLGILGGGQLGKMLLNDTRKFDIQTLVLDPSEEAPSKVGCSAFYKGNLNDYDTVYQFGKKCNVLTIEIEHVNLDALEQLETEGLLVYPSPKTLRLIKNKGRQKDFYLENNIPTSKYQSFMGVKDVQKALDKDELNFPFVFEVCNLLISS